MDCAILNILVYGFYDCGNCGDEAYKIAFRKLFPLYNFTFSHSLDHTTAYDVIFVGGGDVLTPTVLDKIQSLPQPVYALSIQGNEKIHIERLAKFKQVLVRNRKSTNTTNYTPDFAFALESNKILGKQIIHTTFEKYDLYQNVVGVVVNAHLFADIDRKQSAADQMTFNKFAYDLAGVMDNVNASFLFIPFGTQMPWDDRISNGVVASRAKFWKKNAIIYNVLSPQNTLDVIAACDSLISMRLHASIFSTISHVPFIDITHNHKNTSFLEDIDYKFAIPYKRFELNHCKDTLNYILENKYSLSESLQIKAKKQSDLLKEVIRGIRISK